ncbi:MAG: FAD-dependent oxidoreductase, partial [Bacteroidia bacterium]|nr:FAD-dependent oxidoreductase [Bacteroidia bacterium]
MKYDVAVIGSGPGGYVAAIRCAQLGKKTAIIEKYTTLGGTCLNVGCIPSKALLDSSEHYHNATHTFATHGIDVKEVQVNLKQMIARKSEVVKQNTDGINFLMKKNKIDVYTGMGSFVNKNTIRISGEKEQTIEADKVIIATGSKPASLPGLTIDKKRIITSTEALEMTEIPKHLIIIGGGVIGLELGSVYARMGAKVSVVEYTGSIIPMMDGALGKELQRVLRKLGFEFFFNHKVTGALVKGKEVTVSAENAAGEKIALKGDYCLVSVGRKPYTDGLNLEAAGLTTDERGRIAVDAHLQTSV